MDTTTATITTIGVIALAAITYRLFLNSAKADPAQNLDDDRILATNDNGAIDPAVYGLITHPPTLSEALTRPMATDGVDQNYHQAGLDNYGSPRLDDSVARQALLHFENKVGLIKEGFGYMLAKECGTDDWWPICYRRGHDALGFMRAWLFQANGPGGKFCWHISLSEKPHGRPITVTSWGTIGTLDEIKEIASKVAA